MSFSIDLWNGIHTIKEKYTSIRREFRLFTNFLTKYYACEIQHCKNLDSLYNEFKEINTNKDSNFEKARINVIEMINIESKARKSFIEDINTRIVKKINLYLQELNTPTSGISELTENFNKEIEKLKLKQDSFYSQCKEMSSLISQLELDNKMGDKNNENKLNKTLNKLIKVRDEYLSSINDTNIKRVNYNQKVSDIMDRYEKNFRDLLGNFFEKLKDFKTRKVELFKNLSDIENSDFLKLFSNLEENKEILNFIIANATKEFPMVQIEFSPFKRKDFETFLNSKYHNKLKQSELNKVMNSIKNYFQKNNIFPLNFVQTGISKSTKTQKENFFSLNKKFQIFFSNNNDTTTTNKKNVEDKSTKEKEIEIINNYEFIKKFVNELVSENQINVFESKYVFDGDINKILNDDKSKKSIKEKIAELNLLLDSKTENHLVYIESLIKMFSYLRSKGYFLLKSEVYDIFKSIFIFILEQNKNNDYILKNILLLAQTFYKIENDERIYLQQGIKGTEIFNSPKAWHRCINYSLKLANTNNRELNLYNGKELINKINKEAYGTVITFLCDLKAFTDDEKVYEEVKEFYRKVYKLNENDINSQVENSVKSRTNIKENNKEEIKNEIKENIKDKNNNNNENSDNNKIEGTNIKEIIQSNDNKKNENNIEVDNVNDNDNNTVKNGINNNINENKNENIGKK